MPKVLQSAGLNFRMSQYCLQEFFCSQILDCVWWVFDHICCCCGAVEDLLKYLDPQFTDHITVPDAMKLEFILAGKNQEDHGIDKSNKK